MDLGLALITCSVKLLLLLLLLFQIISTLKPSPICWCVFLVTTKKAQTYFFKGAEEGRGVGVKWADIS